MPHTYRTGNYKNVKVGTDDNLDSMSTDKCLFVATPKREGEMLLFRTAKQL